MRTEQLARAPVAPADLSAAEQVALGRARQAEGDLGGAESHYARALALVHSYGPAIVQLRVLAPHHADRAEGYLDAVLDPTGRDITKHCFVHFDDECVLFDDFNCLKASPDFGERRAFREFLAEQVRFKASPWFTYGFNGAAYFLHERMD